MENFKLQLFFHIIGVGSASGILFHNQSLFLCADNSSFLYEYHMENNQLEKHALYNQTKEYFNEDEKPGFESLLRKDDKLLILASGSNENKNTLKSFHINSKKTLGINFKTYFDRFREIASLQQGELNIEGMITFNNKTLFFQKGNGAKVPNGIFILDEKNNTFEFKKIELIKLNGKEACFSDAVFVNNRIYFLANATEIINQKEQIHGAYLGIMNTDLIIENSILLSDKNKFEGITLFEESENSIDFLLSESIKQEKEADIFKLSLIK